MAEAGLVSLDPARLSGLECYLRGLADGCRNGSADVDAHLWGTGESGATEVGELRRLAEWCRINADGVAWRRALVEALPQALPLPDLVFASAATAGAGGTDVGGRLREALGHELPDWPVVARLVAEVARGDHEPAFLAAVREALGPALLLRLPGLLATSHDAATGPSGGAEDPVLLATLATVQALCAAGPEPDGGAGGGEGAPASTGRGSLAWAVVRAAGLGVDDEQIDLVERAVEDVGSGIDAVRGISGVARHLLRGGTSGSLTPLAGAGLVLDLVDLVDDPEVEEVLTLVADGLLAAAPVAGAAAPFLFAAGAVAAVAGFALGRPWDLDDDDRDVRRDDTGRGPATYPSGSPSNPEVDTAGVPLGPGYA